MQGKKNGVTQVVSHQGYPELKGHLLGQGRSGFLSSLASSCTNQVAIQLLKMEVFEMGFKPTEDFSIHSPQIRTTGFQRVFFELTKCFHKHFLWI